MCATRFDRYIVGGRPDGGVRVYPGSRDRTPPSASAPVTIDGVVYFAGESPTWGGGMAFLDPDRAGRTPARAWRVRLGQFADIWAQERRRDPGTVRVPLAEAISTGRVVDGDDRYAMLLALGDHGGEPLLTFTAPAPRVDLAAPNPVYRETIAAGLIESHGWDIDRARRHITALVDGAGSTTD